MSNANRGDDPRAACHGLGRLRHSRRCGTLGPGARQHQPRRRGARPASAESSEGVTDGRAI